MRNAVILYCGSSFTKSLYDVLLDFELRPILLPSNSDYGLIFSLDPLAIFISGSPEYVNSPKAPKVDTDIYDMGCPILGICYGMQRMAKDLGGEVKRMKDRERELVHMEFTNEYSALFDDFTDDGVPVWMAHVCKVTSLPPGFVVTGTTEETEVAAMEDVARGLYAVQFHPEHRGKDPSSQAGSTIIWNFLSYACGHSIG